MDLLIDALDKLDIPYGDRQVQAFSRYLRILKKWSQAYNLTSLSEDRDIIYKHFFDSLLYLKVIPEDAKMLLDIGSGAGFPGVPLKIVKPGLKIYLMEPSRKKTAFLRHLVKTLSLSGIYVLKCRVEDYPCGHDNMPDTFDVIVTRALFKMNVFLEKTSHLCNDKSVLIMSKGKSYLEELQDIDCSGCEVMKTHIPEYNIVRYLIKMRCQKKPLASR